MPAYSIGCLSFEYDPESGAVYRTLDFLECRGYRIDAQGGVWSSRAKGSGRIGNAWRAFKHARDKHGYQVALLRTGRKKVMHKVHRLVLKAFWGPCPHGQECRHLNGERADNRLENLVWGTQKENAADRKRHKRDRPQWGEHNPGAKLTEAKVVEVRRLHATGNFSYREIGEMMGVHLATICEIIRGRTWKHVREGK